MLFTSNSGTVCFFQPGLDLQQHLLSNEAAMITTGLTLQLHVVVICINTEQLFTVGGSISSAVILNNLYYKKPSVTAAGDTRIKVCFVMNLNYTTGSKSS